MLHAPLLLTLHVMARTTKKTPRLSTFLTPPFVHSKIFRPFAFLLREYQPLLLWAHTINYARYESGGIVPSNKTQYMLNDLESIVESQTGAIPYFGCVNNGTVLSEVWYFNHVFGTVCDTLN